jgi:hypothetical protein
MRTAKFSKPVCVSLNQAIYDELKQISDRRRESIAEVVRDIIDGHFEREAEEDKRSREASDAMVAEQSKISLKELVAEDHMEMITNQTKKDIL